MKNLKLGLSALSVLTMMTAASPTVQAGEPFVGEIRMFGGNYCPRGWGEARGQLIAISQNQTLFSLYGTYYGGDGRTTFALPDFQGRMPIGDGAGPGLTPKRIGQRGGAETVVNRHRTDSRTYLEGKEGAKEKTKEFAEEKTANFAVHNGKAETNQPPFLAIRVCIAMLGIYPSRN